MTVLQAEGIQKSFTLHLQGGIGIAVLRDVALTLRAGECVALAGPSGAGKSTFMRCLYGNYGCDGGSIHLRHHGAMLDIAQADARVMREVRRDTMGYVSQFLRVIPRVSSLDIVAEPMRARGVPAGEARTRAAALLTRLNMPAALHGLPPATFSGGEQQRVNLARGFAAAHPVLLLDEPTASLDSGNAAVVIALIEEAKAAGQAIIGIFHDLPVRDRVADRLLHIEPVYEPA